MTAPGAIPPWASLAPDGALLLRVKAVPGARRDEIAGVLGDGERARLKIRVSAPPEGGKANKAICAIVAATLGVKPRDVTVQSGASSAEKTLRVGYADAERLKDLG